MNIVVDASVLVAAVVADSAHGEWAEDIVRAGELYAPELARVEATNILRRLERAKQLTPGEANGAFDDLTLLTVQMLPFDPFADRIWQLRHTVTSYDAWYIAVAEALDLPLATLDFHLAKAKGPVCRFLSPGPP